MTSTSIIVNIDDDDVDNTHENENDDENDEEELSSPNLRVRTLESLDYPIVLRALANECNTSFGMELVLSRILMSLTEEGKPTTRKGSSSSSSSSSSSITLRIILESCFYNSTHICKSICISNHEISHLACCDDPSLN